MDMASFLRQSYRPFSSPASIAEDFQLAVLQESIAGSGGNATVGPFGTVQYNNSDTAEDLGNFAPGFVSSNGGAASEQLFTSSITDGTGLPGTNERTSETDEDTSSLLNTDDTDESDASEDISPIESNPVLPGEQNENEPIDGEQPQPLTPYEQAVENGNQAFEMQQQQQVQQQEAEAASRNVDANGQPIDDSQQQPGAVSPDGTTNPAARFAPNNDGTNGATGFDASGNPFTNPTNGTQATTNPTATDATSAPATSGTNDTNTTEATSSAAAPATNDTEAADSGFTPSSDLASFLSRFRNR